MNEAAFVTPRTPPLVQRVVFAGRSLVGHIVFFRGDGRHLRMFGHDRCWSSGLTNAVTCVRVRERSRCDRVRGER